MQVDVDDESYEVYLCDEHAETATMGTVKTKVKEIRDKLKYAVQLAKDLGINIPELYVKPQNTGANTDQFDIMPGHKSNTRNAEASETEVPEATKDTPIKPAPVDKSKVIERDSRPVKISGDKEINRDTHIEMQKVSARGGTIDIPRHSEGDAGVTDISILETKDDIIQNRTKMLKQAGEQGNLNRGYSSMCLACNGSGTHPVTKDTCPKCNGSGMRMI